MSKKACFDFDVIYRLGEKNPVDFASGNLVEETKYSNLEREDEVVQNGDSDEKVLIPK